MVIITTLSFCTVNTLIQVDFGQKKISAQEHSYVVPSHLLIQSHSCGLCLINEKLAQNTYICVRGINMVISTTLSFCTVNTLIQVDFGQKKISAQGHSYVVPSHLLIQSFMWVINEKLAQNTCVRGINLVITTTHSFCTVNTLIFVDFGQKKISSLGHSYVVPSHLLIQRLSCGLCLINEKLAQNTYV